MSGNESIVATGAGSGNDLAIARRLAERGAAGIAINCVAPAAIQGPLAAGVIRKTPDGTTPERALSRIHPPRRIGKPEQGAPAVARWPILAASFVSGGPLAVDGGLTARAYRYEPEAHRVTRYGSGRV